MPRGKRWIWILIGITIIIAFGIGGFLFWAGDPYPATPEALTSLESDALVRVQQDPWIIFMPQEQEPSTGLIFYPGGLVEAQAYAPAARTIAEASYLMVITPLPLHLAVLNPNAASDVLAAYPEIENWAIGGHSLGGAMAATFASQNPGTIAGLVLWASYSTESSDLSNQAIAVTSIYGTIDGVATPDKVLAAKPLLPQDTIWVPIEGGNHAQFGYYGPQEGDNPATISHEEQQKQTIDATLALLRSIGGNR